MNKNTIISLVISLGLVGGMLYLVSDKPSSIEVGQTAESQNVEIKDGVQYVTIAAKGGYSPRLTEIKGGVPTKLVIKTNGTYDCSASLVIRSIGFQKILPPIGEQVIDLGTPQSGEKVQGVCGMGMYNFQIATS